MFLSSYSSWIFHKDIDKKLKQIPALCGEHKKDGIFLNLSGGKNKRCAIARALDLIMLIQFL